jgi:hypothetical protein
VASLNKAPLRTWKKYYVIQGSRSMELEATTLRCHMKKIGVRIYVSYLNLQLIYLLFDGCRCDQAVDNHIFCLSNSINMINTLIIRTVKRRIVLWYKKSCSDKHSIKPKGIHLIRMCRCLVTLDSKQDQLLSHELPWLV